MKSKPAKIIYETQSDALNNFEEFIIPHLQNIPQIQKALVWGSLVNNTFGIYTESFNHHIASDVDLIIFLEKGSSVPNEFKYLNVNKSWFKGYKSNAFRKFIYKGNLHKVDILLVKSEFNEDFVRKRIKQIKGGNVKKIYQK